MMSALDLMRAFSGKPRALCANPTCAKPVRVKGDYCSPQCAPGCWLCARKLFPGHLHIEKPKR